MRPVPPTQLPPILLVTDIRGGDDSALCLLERSSHPVTVCADLEEAQPHLLHNRPGLILVDLRANANAGLETCQAIGKLPHAAGIPRLLTLAELDAGTRQKAYATGANDYLALPLLAKELAGKIAAHLRPDVGQSVPYLSTHAASDETFNRLAAALPENVIRYDRQGRSIYLSPSLLRVFGPLTSNLLGWTVRELFPDGSYDRYAEVLDQVLASGEGQQIEIQVDIPGKETREIHQIRFVPEKDEQGQVTGTLAIGLDVTERKRIERDLVLLDLALVASSDAVFLMDHQGLFVYVNQAACDSLGYSREELQTMRPFDIDPNFTPESFRLLLDKVLNDGPLQGTFESTHRRRDGSTFPVELGASVAVLGGEKFCMAIARDITERKAAEERLHASEQAVRAIVENSPDFIIRYDEQGRRLYMNPAVLRVLERPWEELRGTHLRDGNPALDLDRYEALVQQVFETGEEVSEEIMGQNKYGVVKWRQMQLVPERDKNGKVVSVLAIARDINDLKQSEERFRTLADHSPNIIIRYDTELRRVYANPAYERETEFKVQQVLMSTPSDHWWGSASLSATEYQDKLRNILTGGREDQFEMSWTHPSSGKHVHHSMQMVPEYNWKREVVGVLCIGHDITPLKAAEARLRESYDLLQELASRRETAREEERKRIAREIHDELGQRMTALKLKIAVLRLQFGDAIPALADATTMLTDTVDQAVRVIRNLSAMLRPAAIELGVVPSLEWLANEFQRNSGISCELGAMPSDLDFSEECAIALFRVAQESLTNVSRHARASRVRITLEQQDDQYVLEIADDGAGFEVQSQGQRTFGLAGIRERMMAVGGDAAVESAPGRGTRVRASLPACANRPAPGTATLH